MRECATAGCTKLALEGDFYYCPNCLAEIYAGDFAGQVSEVARYAALSTVFSRALSQSRDGKGNERHACKGEKFEEQIIVRLGHWLGSNHFEIGQAVKKAVESVRLPKDRAVAELLGAMVYLAAAVVVLETEVGKK